MKFCESLSFVIILCIGLSYFLNCSAEEERKVLTRVKRIAKPEYDSTWVKEVGRKLGFTFKKSNKPKRQPFRRLSIDPNDRRAVEKARKDESKQKSKDRLSYYGHDFWK